MRGSVQSTSAAAAVASLLCGTPAGTTSTDLSFLTVQLKQAAAGTPPGITAVTSGWTALGSAVNTGDNLNATTDVGTNYLWTYYREGVVNATTVDTSGANSGSVSMASFATTLGGWDIAPQSTTGVDATSGANGSITGAANISITTGDWLF